MKKQISPENQKRLDTIACYLRELRLNENLSQKEVESGLHRNTISRVENARNFNILSLFEIADFFSLSPAEILSILN